MPSLIFLIPVLSSTMVPVARTVVVILETFLLEEIDLFVLEEKTLLLPARDADKDMDKTEEAILIYQFYLRCCVLCVITMRKFFCARSKKKEEIDVTLLPQKGKKKVKIPEILFSFGPRGDLFFLNKKRKGQKGEEKTEEGRKANIIFKKNPIYFITDYNAHHHHHHHLFFLSLSLPTKYILF